jgi:hypothetical protein
MRSVVGPERERCPITKREDMKWWQIVAGVYREDNLDLGRLRPAFGVVAIDLLRNNGDTDAE